MREQSQPGCSTAACARMAVRRATDAHTRSRAQAREIIENHRPEPLDDDVVRQMRAFVQAADQERSVQ